MGIIEDREWHKRRGRFKDCDDDEPGRVQIKPGLLIPVERQTHNRDKDGRILPDGSE